MCPSLRLHNVTERHSEKSCEFTERQSSLGRRHKVVTLTCYIGESETAVSREASLRNVKPKLQQNLPESQSVQGVTGVPQDERKISVTGSIVISKFLNIIKKRVHLRIRCTRPNSKRVRDSDTGVNPDSTGRDWNQLPASEPD